MNDGEPRRDDPIHQLFRKLREGFSDMVVNLVERVDRKLQLFIEDERHQSPDLDKTTVDGLKDVATVFSSMIPATIETRSRDEYVAKDSDDDT